VSTAVIRHGAMTVVVEGAARIGWRRSGAATWAPERLWPTADEAAELLAAVRRGEALLVVFDETPATVAVLAEEFAQAAPALAELAEGGDATGGEVVELRVPPLNWLPEELRRRGLRFLRDSRAKAARTPTFLLPPLVIDEPSAQAPNVRFAHRLRHTGACRTQLPQIAAHLFAELAVEVTA
jgi:hypothetical protein